MEEDCAEYTRSCVPCQKQGISSIIIKSRRITCLLKMGDGYHKTFCTRKRLGHKTLATIIAQPIQRFLWKNIACQYRIPNTIIIDNGRQCIDKGLVDFYKGLRIKRKTGSIEHPWSNGQAEIVNKVILVELEKRLDKTKGKWKITIKSSVGIQMRSRILYERNPFNLVYGTNAMIPVEIRETTL